MALEVTKCEYIDQFTMLQEIKAANEGHYNKELEYKIKTISTKLVHHFPISYTFSLVCIPDCCVVFPLRCHRIAIGKTPCSAEIHTS